MTDPQHRLLVDAVRVALQDAGYGKRAEFARAATGVFVGASVSEHKDLITSRMRSRRGSSTGSSGAWWICRRSLATRRWRT